MLTTFDHATLAVADLATAQATYTRLLGRGPLFVGDHPELGTESAIFGLSNGALELVGPKPQAEEAAGLRALLDARGEGLSALAFGCDDADAWSAALRARGVRATAPQAGEAHARDGARRSYRTVELSPRTTRGLHVFAVERADHGALRLPRPDDGTAMDALDHVVVRTCDVAAARALYGEALGLRLALEREVAGTLMLFFRIGGVTVEVIEDRTCGATDVLHGLAYRVRDLDGAHARLAASGLDVSAPRAGRKPETRVFSVRSGTCGVPTLVLYDPSRR